MDPGGTHRGIGQSSIRKHACIQLGRSPKPSGSIISLDHPKSGQKGSKVESAEANNTFTLPQITFRTDPQQVSQGFACRSNIYDWNYQMGSKEHPEKGLYSQGQAVVKEDGQVEGQTLQSGSSTGVP